MKKPEENIRVIISGGGTGGHIFPAISIADELKRRNSNTEILFVGALGRMEMERVPAAGYNIVGLPVIGLQRQQIFKNFKAVFGLFRSIRLAKRIVVDFNPGIVIGVGGYASWPTLRVALNKRIPSLIQEQNSYAGISNRLLARKASKICVAYKGMEKYFPKDKIILTGNPVRNIEISDNLRKAGFEYFSLSKSLPVVLVVGGSLGARTINEAILSNIESLKNADFQMIWQTGVGYFKKIEENFEASRYPFIRVCDFISRMDLAYNVADIVISRAGAISISELCLTGKPVILIPSPNVAEDHQTKNALALSDEGAAILIHDKDTIHELVPKILELLEKKELRQKLAANIIKLAKPDSTKKIVDEVYQLIGS